MATTLSWASTTIIKVKGSSENMNLIGLWFVHLKWVHLDYFKAFGATFGVKLFKTKILHAIIELFAYSPQLVVVGLSSNFKEG
jgi:hypothetical protein